MPFGGMVVVVVLVIFRAVLGLHLNVVDFDDAARALGRDVRPGRQFVFRAGLQLVEQRQEIVQRDVLRILSGGGKTTDITFRSKIDI